MVKAGDVIRRVQFKCDDPDGTYVDDSYVEGFMPDALDWLYNELRLTDDQFCSATLQLPGIAAGLPNLDDFQKDGGLLFYLNTPRMIRWKLPGLDPTYYRRADGPLDYPRDMPAGMTVLDSWAWKQDSIKLSLYAVSMDLEVSGEFLFDPTTNDESTIKIQKNITAALVSRVAYAIAVARNVVTWVATYGKEADDHIDDIKLLFVKQQQGKTARVGRISRATGSATRLIPTAGATS